MIRLLIALTCLCALACLALVIHQRITIKVQVVMGDQSQPKAKLEDITK